MTNKGVTVPNTHNRSAMHTPNVTAQLEMTTEDERRLKHEAQSLHRENGMLNDASMQLKVSATACAFKRVDATHVHTSIRANARDAYL